MEQMSGLWAALTDKPVDTVTALIMALAFMWQARQYRQSAAATASSLLSAAASDPVSMAHDINTHRLEKRCLQDFDSHTADCRSPACGVLAEMYLDLADVVSERRRTASHLMDFSLWERYFADLTAAHHIRASLHENRDYYSDHLFALFGQLVVRGLDGAVRTRLQLTRSEPDEGASTDGMEPSWKHLSCGHGTHPSETPYLFAHWRVESMSDARWIAWVCVRRDERRAVTVTAIRAADLEPVVCEELASWFGWHLAEGGVSSATWAERTWRSGSGSFVAPMRFTWYRWKRTDRGWMDAGNPRFSLPLYRPKALI